MFWLAITPSVTSGCAPPTEPPPSTWQPVGWWALQFSPKVALLPGAVLIEAHASLRLFGGGRALLARVDSEARELLDSVAIACAPTGQAALILARAGITNGFKRPLAQLLDEQPLQLCDATATHEALLSRIGCRTLGDVRRKPRGGLVRRFGQALLQALDIAYGLRPESYDWLTVPETFHARLELPMRAESAGELVFGARRLLLQLGGWLTARHAGVRSFALRWQHDTHRANDAGPGGELVIRTADATRDTGHLGRLLAEHLAKTSLAAPVSDLFLQATEIVPLEEVSASLLPDQAVQGEAFGQLLERLAARLGADRVRRPVLLADHRTEWMQRWQPAQDAQPRRAPTCGEQWPQPTWVLPEPLPLATRGERPMYQGPLELLAGPHRVESGWWDRVPSAGEHRGVARDYYIALSRHAGLIWIFRDRHHDAGTGWFLHGIFA